MNDELARFPTPKEAFKQPKRPSHTSSAFDPIGHVPVPPPQQHRLRPGPQSAGPKEYYSTPSTPETTPGRSQGAYRSFSGPKPALANQQQPMRRANPQYAAPQYANTHVHSAPTQPHPMHSKQAPLPMKPVTQPSVPPQPVPPQPIPMQSVPLQKPVPISSSYQDARPHSHPNAYPETYHAGNDNTRRVLRRPVGGGATGGGVPVADQFSASLTSSHSNSSPSLPVISTPPPASESADLRTLFDEVDRHKRGYLTERELSKALVNGDYTLFDAHTVRLMMKMFDRDGDGAIYFAEFGQLWKYLHDWRQVFDRFDISRSDSVNFDEFCRALAAFGYTLTSSCVRFMFNAGSKLNRQGQREMSFDLFVQSCISIKSITDTFKRYDIDRDGYVTMGFEEFLIETTKLH